MKLQRLSEYFGVSKRVFNQKGILDAIIGVDSGFYLDPTLLKNTRIPEFKGAYKQIENHYENAFSMLKLAKGNRNSKPWKVAVQECTFQEPTGIFLGYGSNTKGRGIGKKLATQLLYSAEEILQMGVDDPNVIALLGVLEEGFGADRISDMTINIIQNNLLSYTQRIVRTLALKPTKRFFLHGRMYQLPVNPQHPNEFLILLPTNFLRALPSFDDYIYDACSQNQELRRRVNKILGISLQKAPKNYIKSAILSDKNNILAFLEILKNTTFESYDFKSDPEVKQKWLEIGQKIATQYPLKLDLQKNLTAENIRRVVQNIIMQFKATIENQGVAKYLYKSDGHVHHEDFIQKLFLAVATSYCKANNLDISPETDQGSGAVDFKISKGFNEKFLVELKWDKNPNLVEGYTQQLPRYAQCEETANCFFVVVEVSQNGKNLENLQTVYYAQKEQGIKQPELFIIDGKIKPSASKLKRESPKKSIPFFGEEFTY